MTSKEKARIEALEKRRGDKIQALKDLLGPRTYLHQLKEVTGLSKPTIKKLINNWDIGHRDWPKIRDYADAKLQDLQESEEFDKRLLGEE